MSKSDFGGGEMDCVSIGAQMDSVSIHAQMDSASIRAQIERVISINSNIKTLNLIALIDRAAPQDLNVTDKKGKTLLHFAAWNGFSDITLKLIEKMRPEDLRLKDHNGWTALHWLADKKDTVIAFKLIEKMHPKDLGLQNKDGMTALHLAVKDLIPVPNEGLATSVSLTIALELIKKMRPEDIILKNNKGESALYWAKKNKDKEITNAIRAKVPAGILGGRFSLRSFIPTTPKIPVENESSPVLAKNEVKIEWGNIEQVREILRSSIESGRAGEGLSAAEPFLAACRDFLDTVQKSGQDSMIQFAQAQGQIRSISKSLEEYHKSVQALQADPQSAIPGDDLKGRAVSALRRIFPALDPMRGLAENHSETLDLLGKAFASSQGLIQLHEGLDAHYPEIDETLSELESVIAEASRTAELEAEQESDLHEKQILLRLKKVFEGVAAEVHGHRGLMRASHQATGLHINTEIDFINSLRHARTAMGALNLNRSFIVAQIKHEMSGGFAEEAREMLGGQLEIAGAHLSALQSSLSERQQGIAEARHILIAAQASSISVPELSAA